VDLARAADILNAAEKVAILVGAGALGAGAEVMQVADTLGAGVAKALLGKAVVPDDVPYVTGPIGLLGSKASTRLMNECDTLLMVGSTFPYSEFLPAEGKAKGIQIDIDGANLNLRYPMDVSLVGDSGATLRALLPRLQRKTDREWQARVEETVGEWWRALEQRAMLDAQPLNPQRVFWDLSSKLPDRAIVTADAGTVAVWYARDLKLREGMLGSLSGGLASMGSAVPYAIAAKFCYPDRVAIALAGDGAMQMNGLNELITIAKYWREWQDPRLVVLVLNNRDLNMVTWEQRVLAGDPKFTASQSLPDFPYADFASSIGLMGVRVDRPDQVAVAWDAVLHTDRPAVLEAVVDPTVPPLPPHTTVKQAASFAAALVKGDPDAATVLKNTIKETFRR
jgi:pyruvate dehydrogenase (quinone)